MRLLLWLVAHALALWAAIGLIAGIHLDAAGPRFVVQLVVTGAIFGLVSAVVKPVVKLLSLPLIVLTLGLFLLVVNALMLLLTSTLASALGLGFHVDGFGAALFGSIVISLVGMLLHALLPDRQ